MNGIILTITMAWLLVVFAVARKQGRRRELTKIKNRVQRYNKNLHPMEKRSSKFATYK